MRPTQRFSLRLSRRALRCAIRNTPELRGQRSSGTHPVHSRTTRLLVLFAVCLGTLSCATWRGALLYQRGTQALEQGELERAVSDLEEAARLVPDASEVHNHLGLAQLAAGRDDLALRSFERATALDCDNQAARDNLAILEIRLLQEAAIASVSPRPAPEAPAAQASGGIP